MKEQENIGKVKVNECHSEPFACHSDPERREGEESRSLTQGRLHEEFQRSFVSLRMTP